MDKTSQPGFYGLGIAPSILDVLKKSNFSVPTPIQLKSIPIGLEGKDIIGIAQTGTGKTLAFGIPVAQNIIRHGGVALITAPTRELAFQINETVRLLALPLGLRSAVIVGGDSMYRQIQLLRRSPHILVGTPGRIIDHLERKTMNLSGVKILVLDEADRMLDMGFAPQLKRILAAVPRERQTMLFSATMPESIVDIARAHMRLPVRVEIAPPGTPIEKITQELIFINRDQKVAALDSLLKEQRGSVLVFTRTKFGAEKVARAVKGMGHAAAEIHSNRTFPQRRDALEGFKSGKYRVLVATDIAARGIDVQHIELVVNFDLPDTTDAYVHRIGRTGRAGAGGRAVSFATPDQRRDVREIERVLHKTLPSLKVPGVQAAELPPQEEHRAKRPFSGRRPHFSPRGNPRSNNTPRFRGPHQWRGK